MQSKSLTLALTLALTKLKMGKQKEEEKSAIVRCLAEGRNSTEIAKELCQDHRNVKRFIANANQTWKRCENGRYPVKTDFQTVLFTDECRATLDGPDGWCRGWLVKGWSKPSRVRRQQGGRGVLFWAGIIGNEFVGPFRVPDGVKMNALTYRNFLQDNFIPWYRSKRPASRKNIIFIQARQRTIACCSFHCWIPGNIWIQERKIDDMAVLITWPYNPIENFWSLLKRKLYTGGKQYASKDELWDSILQSAQSIGAEEIENLTKSVDNRLVKVLSNNGNHVNM